MGALFFYNTTYSGGMDKTLIDAFNGAQVVDGSETRKVRIEDNKVMVDLKQDVGHILAENEVLRNEAQYINARPDFDNEGYVHVGRIPGALYRLWEADLPSGLTAQEKMAELMKLLSGEWAKLNVSKYKRLS
jgi:hypothetical protein